VSLLSLRLDDNLTPFPKKLFSLTEKPMVPPSVPIPAPRLISPVGFSSTLILIIFVAGFDPSTVSDLTVLKIFKDFKLFKLFACRSSLNGSPSSTSKLALITLYSVILFPKTLMRST